MRQLLVLFLMSCFLSSCSFFGTTNSKTDIDYARCKEIKNQIMFLHATNNETVATQRAAETDTLYRSYRESGCS